MSEPSPASPEPLRRRRSRERAAGAAAEDDSWAHLVGVSPSHETGDGEQGDAVTPAPDAPPLPRRDRVRDRAPEEAPLSRRAARRREAEGQAAPDDTPPPAASTGGVPLRPWWASAPAGAPTTGPLAPPPGVTGPAAGGPATAPDPAVPAAFRSPEPPPHVPVEPLVPREQPQVNPWPGQVRPALPPTGTPAPGRSPAQRTSDVAIPPVPPGAAPLPPAGAPRRSLPASVPSSPASVPSSPAPRPPAEVVLPDDRVPVAGPLAGPPTGPLSGLPGSAGASSHGARFGSGPVLPAPELPGPVLPGVERFADAPAGASDANGERGPGDPAPLRRRRVRAASAPASAAAPGTESGPATGTIHVPTTSGAGAAPQTDLRVVPAAGAAAEAPSSATGSARRRLAATPVRFPALGPSGDVVDADPFPADAPPAAPRTRTGAAPAAPPTDDVTSTIALPRRGRRAPTAGATPAVGIPGLPSVSGPATAGPGSAGLPLPGLPVPGLPGSLPAASTAGGALGGAAGGLLGRPLAAPAAGATAAGSIAGAAGPAAGGALDVVAGLGRVAPGTAGTRRPDAGRARGRSTPRPPLRAVGAEDDDRATRTIEPVGPRLEASAGDPPPSRRAARHGDTPAARAVPGEDTTLTPAAGGDETAMTRGLRPRDLAAGLPGGPPAADPPSRRDTTTRRAARSGKTGEAPVTLAAVPAPASRAGRNLPAAIGVGVGLGALVLGSLLLRKEVFVLVVAAAILVALWELTGVLRRKNIEVPLVPLGVGALGMLVSAFVAGEDGLLVSFALTAFGVLLWRIIDGHDGATRDVAASVFVAAYVPFLAGFAMLMLAMPDGALRVLTFIAVTISNDIGGYAAGVLAGRHPMAPTISPKKSWEGFAGSVALCMIVGVATVHYLLHGSVVAGLALGVAAALTATLGDLSESLIKRDLGVKDMGTLLPGHGGIMDRLDSLLPTAPAAYLLLLLLVPAVH